MWPFKSFNASASQLNLVARDKRETRSRLRAAILPELLESRQMMSVSTLATLHGSNGAQPSAGVIEVNNMLYGTTISGGAHGDGTIYQYCPSTQKLSTLYSFSGGSSNGSHPDSDLIDVNGILYGVTYAGGTGNDGTLFCYNIGTGQVKTDVLFHGSNGEGPNPGLLAIGNDIYGTTALGGSSNQGTVFEYVIGGSEKPVVSFSGSNGSLPTAGVAECDGYLYGTTEVGGSKNLGTIFCYNPANGGFDTEYTFNGANGSYPEGGLAELNKTLYGTTDEGGSSKLGTAFKYNPLTGALSTVVTFHGSNGADPDSTMVAYDGCLYGTTPFGGANNGGTVFCYNPTRDPSEAESAIYSFANGTQPMSDVYIFDNNLYGTTRNGGSADDGTLFELSDLV